MTDDHIAINRDLWNRLAEVHVNSSFYDVAGFLQGRDSLTPIEQEILGDVAGKLVLHLQCHFGMDTLSLARRGAQVTGVDFSEVALEKARQLNDRMGLDARFVLCDVNELPKHLEGQFDIVFASFGVLGWHPDLNRWASVVAHFLKPGGRFCLAEFHPVLWMLNDDHSGIGYSYFKKAPIVMTNEKSYADPQAGIMGASHCWNYSLGELFGALESNGLSINGFKEYDYSPWNLFANGVGADGKYYIKHLKEMIPLSFSLVATKK
jgi:SAM-dependent methyltransferase